MPPALRRSASFSPRSSSAPYTMTRPSAQRRSTGSEMTHRRVLQELDWFKVMSGQEPVDIPDDDEQEPEQELVEPDAGRRTPELVPVAEMAALAIAPRTPTMGMERHGQESSTSSVESSPEQGPALGFFAASPVDAEQPFRDASSLSSLPPALRRTRSESDTLPDFVAFGDFSSADFSMSPLSSPPMFSN